MKLHVSLRHLHVAIAAVATLGVASAGAQTAPPVPNFSLRPSPNLFVNVWPADFNRDGRTDLIAGTRPGLFNVSTDLLVATGRGDGTFNAPRSLGIAAYPVGTGDFNRDGRIDVVIVDADEYLVLPGNGNGTFGRPVTIGPAVAGSPFEGGPFAVVADFNNDGRRDVTTPGVTASGDGAMLVYPGHGDFSFGPPVELASELGVPVEGISGDFNEDGRRDLAVVTVCCSAFVFLNRGGLLFESREIFLADDLADITTADMNGDSHLDLLVAASFVSGQFAPRAPGTVAVLLGNGNGTFQPKTVFDTGVLGEITIVAGDFNGDGHVDVATGNWSVEHDDDWGDQLWDSISILPGDGTGRLLRATTYALGRVNRSAADAIWMFTHNSLNTSDLNGDRRTDLIASPGVILLNRPPTPNRTPTVFAGADRTVYEPSEPFNVEAIASDPDRHWLTYRWTLDSGQPFATAPLIRVRPGERGTFVFTVGVDDGHGGTASDSVRITVADDRIDPFVALFQPEPPAGGTATLRWIASADRGIRRFDLWWSTTQGRSWARIAECTGLPATARSCITSNTAVAEATLRIVATDGSGRQWISLANYPFMQ